MKIKYDYKNCPCPHDCQHRSSCADCMKHHHSRNQLTYCEKLAEKADAAHHTPGPRSSGKKIRLLDYGACAGWAGKLKPSRLAGILNKLPKVHSDNLLVDMGDMDDAGVYKVSDDVAIVQTVDFFFPIVNDPREFGRIAAANSLSDVWAMGATALTAMNVLAYPAGKIPEEAIEELLIGGSEKLKEANVVLVGGHTMEQEELIYGMSVTGSVHPNKILTNVGARPGDLLILTKPLGTGVMANALEQGGLSERDYRIFVHSMERLNKYACVALLPYDVSALTDVTGFGLLGHSLPIAKGANVTIRIHAANVPLFGDIFELMETFTARRVSETWEYISPYCNVLQNHSPELMALLSEAQTSGGLLAAVHPKDAHKALSAIQDEGDEAAAIVGEVLPYAGNNEYLQIF